MKYSCSLSALLLAGTVQAHTWVELLNIVASNGTMVGTPGYPRGNVLRTAGVEIDPQMTWLLPPNGRSGANPNAILATDKMCKPSQSIGNQTSGSPALIASPGDMVALRYQENGHVTLPATQIGKPANRGTVYIYGTTKPSNDDTLLSIHKVWNAAGTGGDANGVLLATRNFDDGQCYQVNSGALSVQRQADFAHAAVEPMGVNIWCQSDVTLPTTAPTSGLYTMYWVWEWPTAAGTAGYPNGKNETYTTCMDISMQAKGATTATTKTGTNIAFKAGQDLNYAAVSDQLADAFLVTTGTSGVSAASTTSKASSSASKLAASSVPGVFVQTNGAADVVKTVTIAASTVTITITPATTTQAACTKKSSTASTTSESNPLALLTIPAAQNSKSTQTSSTKSTVSILVDPTSIASNFANVPMTNNLNIAPFTMVSSSFQTHVTASTTKPSVVVVSASSNSAPIATDLVDIVSQVQGVAGVATSTSTKTSTIYITQSAMATIRGRVVRLH